MQYIHQPNDPQVLSIIPEVPPDVPVPYDEYYQAVAWTLWADRQRKAAMAILRERDKRLSIAYGKIEKLEAEQERRPPLQKTTEDKLKERDQAISRNLE